MSSLYEPNWSDMESIVEEPIVCFNIDCNYPFGSVCQSCTLEYEARAIAREQAEKDAGSEINEEVSPPKAVVMKSRAESRRDRDDVSERLADIVEDLQSILVFAPPKAREPKDARELTWKNLQTQDLTPAPLKREVTPASGSGDTDCAGDNPPDVPIQDSWLNEVVRNTLDGLLINSPFIGGAGEEDPQETECPYCLSSMGEGAWKELHLRNCRYAHEEAERLETAKGQWLNRRNC